MADKSRSGDRKKPPRAALLGSGVAIMGAMIAIFAASNQARKSPEAPASEQAAPVESDEQNVQTAQFGQSGPTAATPAEPPTEVAGALSADGSAVSFSDDTLTFSATFPPAPADDPVISPLRKDALNYLASRKAEARSTYDDFKKSGDTPPGYPWEVMISWDYTAKSNDIVSLFGTSYEFTGGAHGMTRFDTHIARTNGKTFTFDSMLQGGLSPAIVIAMCEALKVEKQKKIGSPTIFDEPITCAGPNANVKVDRARIVLAPSDQAGKFGGAYAYYEPYEVGAYAEGSYAIAIQQEIFAEDLKPEFKGFFAGKAPPPK